MLSSPASAAPSDRTAPTAAVAAPSRRHLRRLSLRRYRRRPRPHFHRRRRPLPCWVSEAPTHARTSRPAHFSSAGARTAQASSATARRPVAAPRPRSTRVAPSSEFLLSETPTRARTGACRPGPHLSAGGETTEASSAMARIPLATHRPRSTSAAPSRCWPSEMTTRARTSRPARSSSAGAGTNTANSATALIPIVTRRPRSTSAAPLGCWRLEAPTRARTSRPARSSSAGATTAAASSATARRPIATPRPRSMSAAPSRCWRSEAPTRA